MKRLGTMKTEVQETRTKLIAINGGMIKEITQKCVALIDKARLTRERKGCDGWEKDR